MNIFKKFVSKVFSLGESNDTASVPQNDAFLKQAARSAVIDALDTQSLDEVVPEETAHIAKTVPVLDARIKKILDDYNENFFRSFKIDKSHYKIKFDKKNIIVCINNKEFEENLSKSDKLSLAYEHVFLRIVQKEFKNFEYRLSLQAGDSYHRHQKYIAGVAQKIATKVKQTGRKVTVPSKSNYERRLIHSTIEKIPQVASKSVGPYHQRRLIVYPMRNNAPKQND